MSSEAKRLYGQALAARRRGEVSQADAFTAFAEVKPEFYADSKLLSGEVLKVFSDYKNQYPPYGLLHPIGEPVVAIDSNKFGGKWLGLERSLASTIRAAFNETAPPVESCPYHEVLTQQLGKMALAPHDHNEFGLDTLRETSAPGGILAPAARLPMQCGSEQLM